MEIKIGDLVEYRGQHCRVMSQSSSVRGYGRPQFEIRCHDFREHIYPEQVTLIESVNLPKFMIGDRVCVDNVPEFERRHEYGFWVTEMDDYIGNDYQVTKYEYNSKFGPIVELGGGWWFHTWHLIPTGDYDII